MQKPLREIRRFSHKLVWLGCLDQHGADDEHLGGDGDNAGQRHLDYAHFISFLHGIVSPEGIWDRSTFINCNGRQS